MKLLKRMAMAVAVLALLVAGALAMLVASFDADAWKPRLQAAVHDRLHRTLGIGNIRLKVFPKIGLELSRVTISERDSSAPFASLDDAQLYLALMPLLGRQAVVDAVRVSGLHATLVRHADGSTNFDDLRGHDDSAAAAPHAGSGPPVAFDISGILVENSGVQWRDERSGDDTGIELARLETGRLADGRTTPLDVQVKLRDERLATALELRLKARLALDLKAQRYSLSELQLHLGGSAKGWTGIDATLAGRIDAEPDVPRVAVADLVLTAAATQGKLVVQKLGLAVPKLEADLKAHAIGVDHLALTAEGRLDADAFKAHLDAPRLSIDGSQASGQAIHAGVDLSGARRGGVAKLDLAGVEGSASAFRIGQLTLAIDGHSGESALKGTLTSAVSGSMEQQLYRIPRLSGSFAVTAPGLPGKTLQAPVELSALLDLKRPLLHADVAAGIEDSHLKARLDMTPFKNPHYAFDLSVDQLDVDRYLPPKPAHSEPAAAPEAEKPIDLSALKPLRLDGQVAIGKLTVEHLQVARLRATLAASGGRLAINPLALQLYQGSLAGAAGVDSNGNRFTLRQALTGVAIGPLLKDLMGKAAVDGHGNVNVDIATAGATVTALKHGLEGSASFVLKDGAINGINLAESFRKAKSMLGGGGAGGGGDQAADASQKTDFSEMSGSFALHKGVAHNEDLSAKSPFLRLTGKGDIDIGNSRLDYLAQATVVATAGGQGGADLAALKGIPVPVRVSGPFNAPRFRLEYGELLKGMAAAKVQQQVDQVKQQVKEQAQQKLQDALKDKLPGAGQNTNPADALKGLFH